MAQQSKKQIKKLLNNNKKQTNQYRPSINVTDELVKKYQKNTTNTILNDHTYTEEKPKILMIMPEDTYIQSIINEYLNKTPENTNKKSKLKTEINKANQKLTTTINTMRPQTPTIILMYILRNDTLTENLTNIYQANKDYITTTYKKLTENESSITILTDNTINQIAINYLTTDETVNNLHALINVSYHDDTPSTSRTVIRSAIQSQLSKTYTHIKRSITKLIANKNEELSVCQKMEAAMRTRGFKIAPTDLQEKFIINQYATNNNIPVMFSVGEFTPNLELSNLIETQNINAHTKNGLNEYTINAPLFTTHIIELIFMTLYIQKIMDVTTNFIYMELHQGLNHRSIIDTLIRNFEKLNTYDLQEPNMKQKTTLTNTNLNQLNYTGLHAQNSPIFPKIQKMIEDNNPKLNQETIDQLKQNNIQDFMEIVQTPINIALTETNVDQLKLFGTTTIDKQLLTNIDDSTIKMWNETYVTHIQNILKSIHTNKVNNIELFGQIMVEITYRMLITINALNQQHTTTKQIYYDQTKQLTHITQQYDALINQTTQTNIIDIDEHMAMTEQIEQIKSELAKANNRNNEQQNRITYLEKRNLEIQKDIAQFEKTKERLTQANTKIDTMSYEKQLLINDFENLIFSSADIDQEPNQNDNQFVNDTLEKLRKLEVVIVGGHEHWRANLQIQLPDAKIIAPENAGVPLNKISTADIVIINTSILNHALFWRTTSTFDRNDKGKLIYFNATSSNIERSIKTIGQKLSKLEENSHD